MANVRINNKDEELSHAIWMSNWQIMRFRKAKHVYLDGSFGDLPVQFKQLYTILGRDPITDEAVPLAYLALTSKTTANYKHAFSTLRNILTETDTVSIELESFTMDFEKASHSA